MQKGIMVLLCGMDGDREQYMKYIKAALKDAGKIYTLVQETIQTIYPKYYPKEVVHFFCDLHSIDAIEKDIKAQAVGMLLDGESLIGTGTCRENHITRVFVLPGYQRNGYGCYIMQQLEAQIARAYDKVFLDASLPACRFYEGRGYATIRHETWNCENGVVLVYGIMEKGLSIKMGV